MSEVKYPYALDESDQVVSIANLTKETSTLHSYVCIGCGMEMRPKAIGSIYKSAHFYHVGEECDRDNYLHTLSERLFKETYDKTDKFFLQYYVNIECTETECIYKNNECKKRGFTKVNLKEQYPICELEQSIVGKDGKKYIADILLKSDNCDIEPLLIEIWVTHECTEEKKNSGLQIVEINVGTEDDIQSICTNCSLTEGNHIILYNSKKETQYERGKVDILRYVHIPDEYPSLISIPCTNATQESVSNSDFELNIIRKENYYDVLLYDRLNRRFKFEIPSCKSCAHYDSFIGQRCIDDFHCILGPHSRNPDGICNSYKQGKWKDVLIVTDEEKEFVCVKGELSMRYNVFLLAPQTFNNYNVLLEKTIELLKNRLKTEDVVLMFLVISREDSFCLNVRELSKELHLPVDYCNVPWECQGKSAGYKSINTMLQKSNAVIVFNNEQDKLAQYAIDEARKLRIPLRKVDISKLPGVCPLCGGNLRQRNGRRGLFYGCSNFPKCKYSRPI